MTQRDMSTLRDELVMHVCAESPVCKTTQRLRHPWSPRALTTVSARGLKNWRSTSMRTEVQKSRRHHPKQGENCDGSKLNPGFNKEHEQEPDQLTTGTLTTLSMCRLCAATGMSTTVDKLQLRHPRLTESTVWTIPALAQQWARQQPCPRTAPGP